MKKAFIAMSLLPFFVFANDVIIKFDDTDNTSISLKHNTKIPKITHEDPFNLTIKKNITATVFSKPNYKGKQKVLKAGTHDLISFKSIKVNKELKTDVSDLSIHYKDETPNFNHQSENDRCLTIKLFHPYYEVEGYQYICDDQTVTLEVPEPFKDELLVFGELITINDTKRASFDLAKRDFSDNAKWYFEYFYSGYKGSVTSNDERTFLNVVSTDD